jgi:CheY-like chemotaxis protein
VSVTLCENVSVVPASLQILVVDDEPKIASSLVQLLEGHCVQVAGDGRQALAACQNADFDLVFCDIAMPDMTGIEVYRQLERDGRGMHERIVFMTGGAYAADCRDFFARATNTVLRKPFSLVDIDRVIEICRAAKRSDVTSAPKSSTVG